MAISEEDWQRSMQQKRAAMLENKERRRRSLELVAKPHAAEVRRREMDRQAMEARLRQLRDDSSVESIDLDNL